MMLPILISVSVAPESYFFWASALLPKAAKAMTAVESAAILSFCTDGIVSPCSGFTGLGFGSRRSAFSESADQLLADHRHLPRAVRHQEDDEEQQHAKDGAGKSFRDSLGDVRHEDD